VPDRDTGSSPVFQVAFQVLPADRAVARSGGIAGLEVAPVEFDRRAAQLDLNVLLRETGDGLAGVAEYRTDLFEAATVDRMVERYVRLLEAVTAAPALRLSALPLERAGYQAPGSETEELLTRVWVEVLGRERVGVNDDFFGLGGDSLAALRIVARLRELRAVELPPHSVFEEPTPAAPGPAAGRTGRLDTHGRRRGRGRGHLGAVTAPARDPVPGRLRG